MYDVPGNSSVPRQSGISFHCAEGLCKEYQRLVHNSFLLHGYYNYRHLILGRIRQKDAWQYYIGVPGNFYDREKMVAEMFGFEAFEGEKESASPGDYGYYMKRVEI